MSFPIGDVIIRKKKMIEATQYRQSSKDVWVWVCRVVARSQRPNDVSLGGLSFVVLGLPV